MSRPLLIVTNDFPPRQGGIQSFVFELARRLPAEQIAVYCSDSTASARFDAGLNFPVVRHDNGLLIPTPQVRRRARELVERFSSRSVWFGAAAPLALLTASLRPVGVTRAVASTHGHEVGWARLPLARQALRKIGNDTDVVTYLGSYTGRRLAPALGPQARLVQLTPGVDTEHFAPSADGRQVKERHGLTGRPTIVCVSRLVPRKGQDTLIRALPAVRRRVPGAALLVVGGGPYEAELRRMTVRLDLAGDVAFTGPVDTADLPSYFAAGDVFAMPCRTRRFGMDVEGLGMVFLEASAVGVPVVAGDSGGAPDAVRDGETGFVVDGRDQVQVADRIAQLLQDRQRAALLGAAGREWVSARWRWDSMADRLAELLGL